MTKRQDPAGICRFCDLYFEDEYDRASMCESAATAGDCMFNLPKSRAPKLQLVGPDFKRLEDDPVRLNAMRELIRDGAAWHPNVDADGHTGRQAESLIARGIVKAPRSDRAKHLRHVWNEAERLGLHRRRQAS